MTLSGLTGPRAASKPWYSQHVSSNPLTTKDIELVGNQWRILTHPIHATTSTPSNATESSSINPAAAHSSLTDPVSLRASKPSNIAFANAPQSCTPSTANREYMAPTCNPAARRAGREERSKVPAPRERRSFR
ncbi:hypothetical protein BC830DRAFT_921629 [Chytriomyces sp. MP71]|nr:hypothetical protein BC830DRAFT_921629 [Chytriomyces sp. MP71]